MAQKLVQQQQLSQQQVQRISQQQLLQVRLVEMPLAEFEEKVNIELAENPALDPMTQDEEWDSNNDNTTADDISFEENQERQERDDALETALQGIGQDDQMPQVYSGTNTNDVDYEERVYGQVTSFYDTIKEQMGELELTDEQQTIMEYLIGSLDDDGLLRKDLDLLSDELAVNYYIDVDSKQIEAVLHILQGFDPAGIGARSLQECLLLQVKRLTEQRLQQLKELPTNSSLADRVRQSLSDLVLLRRILTRHFKKFTKHQWDKIKESLHLNDDDVQRLRQLLHRLNPKPGASLGESVGRNMQQITPDFIVESGYDGQISFTLSRGQTPELKVSQSFLDMVDTYKKNKQNMSRQDKEALLYAKENVERAQNFIEAIKQRRRTLTLTMQAIIDWQKKYFQDGDESDLKPMILKDIALKTGLDISTISRVCNQKYAQTRWGIFPLRHFFSDSLTTNSGEELSTRKIKLALKELIVAEDKQHPLSDDALSAALKGQGFPVARRTVAKYREQQGIPVARLRKE